MWSPNELLKTEKQRDILSYITLQFFPFKKVPLEHYPKVKDAMLLKILIQLAKRTDVEIKQQRPRSRKT